MKGLPKGPFLEWLEDRRAEGYSTNELARLADVDPRQLYRVEHQKTYALEPSFAEQVIMRIDHGATMLWDLWPRRYGYPADCQRRSRRKVA